MALSYLMLTGSLSGLISVLAHSVLWSSVELVRGSGKGTRVASVLTITEALLHMLCGSLLSVLFALSWGLAALVNVEWWMRGLIFGSLCWLGMSLPILLELIFANRLPRMDGALRASRWATTCVIAGLACAWGAQNGGF